MPRNTLILITVLVLATVGLFGLAVYSLKNPSQAPVKPTLITKAPTPTPVPAPTLYFSSDALTLARGTRGKLGVMLDTHGFSVAQVQLDLAYDASVFGNVVVAPGLVDKLPLAMTSKPSSVSGQLRVAIGASLSTPLKGVLPIATINFTTLVASRTGAFTILPSTVITSVTSQSLPAVTSAIITIVGSQTASPSAYGKQ